MTKSRAGFATDRNARERGGGVLIALRKEIV